MQFTLTKLNDSVYANYGITVEISDEQLKLWEEENKKRMKELFDGTIYTHCYDLDEAIDCRVMSIDHFNTMFRFLTK